LLSNLGSVYSNQGDDVNALDNYYKSLKLAEQRGDKHVIAIAMSNIGVVYSNNKSTYDKALEYYLKSLPLSEEVDDKNVTGGLLVNIGETYLNRDKNDSALYYFKKSLVPYENTENIPYSLNDIGKTYTKEGNYGLANKYHQQALFFAKKSDLQLDVVQSYLGIGTAYFKEGNYREAIRAYENARSISGAINVKKELKDAYQGLGLAYAALKDFKNALRYQTLFSYTKDTLFNLEIAEKFNNAQTNLEIQ
jgi:adenylate cyclase